MRCVDTADSKGENPGCMHRFIKRAVTDRGATNPRRRLAPFIWNEDYLHLSKLSSWLVKHPPTTPGVALEIGAGDSPYRSLIDATKCFATDIRNGEVTHLIGDAHQLPIGNQEVDLILMFQVLSEVQQPHRVMQEVHRVLKPGGEVVVTTSGIWPHTGTSDFHRWTGDGLRQLLAGFDDVAVIPLGGPIAVCAALIGHSVGKTARAQPIGLPRTLARVAAAGLAVSLNATGLLLEQALQQTLMYESLRESMTDAYVARGRKPL